MRKVRVKFLVACLVMTAFPAGADVSGIRFNEMPVGCRIHGQYSTGERVIDEYIGMSGTSHVMKTYEGPAGTKLVRTTTYSRDGLMQRKDWADGNWETFQPASCVDVPGKCTYTYRNGDGAELIYKGRHKVVDNTIVNRGGWVGETPFDPVVSVLGQYNLQISFTEGQTSFKVTKFENCAPAQGS